MKLRIREEQITREMTLEGVASILEGMNPRMLETKLLGFLVDSGNSNVISRAAGGRRLESDESAAKPHSNHERWLVSYADFITLLFAFFVVLYASAQVDQRKVGQLALAIQVAFQELGVFPASNTQIPLNLTEPMPFSTVQAIENAKHNTELGRVSSHPAHELSAEKKPI